LYPSLRVDVSHLKNEIMRNLPPRLSCRGYTTQNEKE
jgi:hypothetical protein